MNQERLWRDDKMSNMSKGRGEKGSKFWMQLLVNTKLVEELNSAIDKNIRWLSPLKNQDDYAEYELTQSYISDITKIPKAVFGFWPSRQPQWDAIAINEEKKILYLVEAKAHLKEFESSSKAKSNESQKQIDVAMKGVFDKYYPKGDYTKWHAPYYQLGNRLTFICKLNELLEENNWKAKLILLNIADDFTYKPTAVEDWKKHYEIVFADMLGIRKSPADVELIYYSVQMKGTCV